MPDFHLPIAESSHKPNLTTDLPHWEGWPRGIAASAYSSLLLVSLLFSFALHRLHFLLSR